MLGYSKDTVVLGIAATATHPGGHFQQHLYMPVRPMDRAVFAIAATATLPVGRLNQHMYTPVRSTDRAVFAIATTATLPVGHLQQHLYTIRSTDRAVFTIATTTKLPDGPKSTVHMSSRLPTFDGGSPSRNSPPTEMMGFKKVHLWQSNALDASRRRHTLASRDFLPHNPKRAASTHNKP